MWKNSLEILRAMYHNQKYYHFWVAPTLFLLVRCQSQVVCWPADWAPLRLMCGTWEHSSVFKIYSQHSVNQQKNSESNRSAPVRNLTQWQELLILFVVPRSFTIKDELGKFASGPSKDNSWKLTINQCQCLLKNKRTGLWKIEVVGEQLGDSPGFTHEFAKHRTYVWNTS